jgi:hypothetical protein
MNPQLNYILAQQRIDDRQRAAEHARLATDAGIGRRDSRESNPVVRALPMPTAHPSPEAWPAASLLAGTSPAPARTRERPALCFTSTEHKLSTAARLKAAGIALSGDQESSPESGRPGIKLRPAFVPGHGDELRSMAFSQPQRAPAAVERSEQLTRLVYELPDAHADAEHLCRRPHSELLWHAHLRYLRDLHWVAREVLADVS